MAANVNPRGPRRSPRVERSAETASSAEVALALPETVLVRPFTDKPLRTRATYRQLMMRGLEPAAAANLTAYMAGLAIGERPWSLPEVNRILFLRELAQGGRWLRSGLDGAETAVA